MAHFYSAPDADLLRESSNTLWSCSKLDENVGLRVIELSEITAVVAMVPHPPLDNPALANFTNRVFVVEKIGLEVMSLVGVEEEDDEEE